MSDAQTGDLESPHCLHHVSLSSTSLKLRLLHSHGSVEPANHNDERYTTVSDCTEPELESSMKGKTCFVGLCLSICCAVLTNLLYFLKEA